MNHSDIQFSSPLTLLAEWSEEGGRLDEAVVLGYTVDLAFLEHFFIAQARGLGARITVLSDAHNAVHSETDVRSAGRTYQHGYALCSGAFHPKLTVLAGEDDIWVAIGSGNPTTSGWGHNRELWLTIKAKSEAGPAALADLADWLLQLPTNVSIPQWIADTLTEVAARVRSAATDSSTDGLKIFGNLQTPILEQLPRKPIDQLGLSAPFFDPGAHAVRALAERMQPQSVTLGIQPTLASYNGQTLVSALGGVPSSEIRSLSETGSRLSHGKLIEWSIKGVRTAMAGSANLSVAALIRTTEAGGNCELVAVREVGESLLPPGDALPRETLAATNTIVSGASPETGPTIVILGARLIADGIEVELVCTAPGDVELQGSLDGGPRSWTAIHSLGAVDGHIRRPVPTQTPCRMLRARLTSGSGEDWFSPTAFITDTVKCRAPEARKSASVSDDYDIYRVFDDTALAERFHKDLHRLLHESAKARTSEAPTVPGAAKQGAQVDSDTDRWRMWIDSFQDTVQPSLAGLLFPGASSILPIGNAGWLIDVDEGVDIAEDEDEDEEPLETPIDDRVARRAAPSIDELARNKWKKWDRNLTAQLWAKDVDLGLRLLVLRVHLDLLAAGLFGSEDDWTWELMDLIEAVVPTRDEDTAERSREVAEAPAEVRRTLGALLAVSFRLLFDELHEVGGDEWDLRAQSQWRALTPLVAEADDAAVEHQLLDPGSSIGLFAGESSTKTLRDRATAALDDPRTETAALLEASGTPAVFNDGVWLLDDESAVGRRTVAQILDTTGDPSAVVVLTSRGVYAALWDADTLLYADTTIKSWRQFTMSGPFRNPRSRLAGDDGLAGSKPIGPISKPAAIFAEVCDRLGVDPQMLTLALQNLASSPSQ